jgi:hypothetical protein
LNGGCFAGVTNKMLSFSMNWNERFNFLFFGNHPQPGKELLTGIFPARSAPCKLLSLQ